MSEQCATACFRAVGVAGFAAHPVLTKVVWAQDITMFLAASHTVFNVVLSAAALPFTKQWSLPPSLFARVARMLAASRAPQRCGPAAWSWSLFFV